MRVTAVERDSRSVGASVRNLGHGCVTGQHGFDRQVVDPLLDALGWGVGDVLDAVVTVDEIPAGRPQAHLIRRARRRSRDRRRRAHRRPDRPGAGRGRTDHVLAGMRELPGLLVAERPAGSTSG